MSLVNLAVQTATISISLFVAGGNAALSTFALPIIESQPASRALPSIRWLFSRGSHIFPTAASISSAGFVYLAFTALPQGRAATQLLSFARNSPKVNGFLAAALLNISIGSFTQLMLPTNFALIEANEKKGGARSENSARGSSKHGGKGSRSAEESVSLGGSSQASQFTDLSNPQSETPETSTPEEDKEIRQLLSKFNNFNTGRILLQGIGGVVGLAAALM